MSTLLTLRAAEELEERFADDVRLLEIKPHVDSRGRLVEFDFGAVPFHVRRAFAVSDVPVGVTRGGHSHRRAAQLLCCVSGCVEVELRRGEVQHRLELTPERGGLLIAPGIWASQRYAEEGTVLAVLASEPFDPSSYETSD